MRIVTVLRNHLGGRVWGRGWVAAATAMALSFLFVTHDAGAADNRIWGVNNTPGDLVQFDAQTGVGVVVGSLNGPSNANAVDPVSTPLRIFYVEDMAMRYVEPDNGMNDVLVGDTANDNWVRMSFDSSRNFYGMRDNDTTLYAIDPTDAMVTALGAVTGLTTLETVGGVPNTSCSFLFGGDIAFGPDSSFFFLVGNDGACGGAVFMIDVATRIASRLSFTEGIDFNGLAFQNGSLFATGGGGGNRRAWMIDAVTGALTEITDMSNQVTDLGACPIFIDLQLTKTVDQPIPAAGSDVVFAVTVTNNGPSAASGVIVGDPLPAGLTFVSASPQVPTTYDMVSGDWDIGALAVAQTRTLTLTATVTALTPVTNTAEVTQADQFDFDSFPGNGMAGEDDIASATVDAPDADLQVVKSDNADPVNAGEDLTYTLNITNNGPDPAPNVVVTEMLPANVTFVSAMPGAPTCNESAGVVTCNLGTLINGASQLITITVTVDADFSGTLTNNVSVGGDLPDGDSTNNDDSEDTSVGLEADLQVVKTAFPDPVAAGGILTYTLTVSNLGSSDASQVVVTDTLPTDLTYVAAVPGAPTCVEKASVLTCTFASIPAFGTEVISIEMEVPADAVDAVNNSADVTADTPDPDPDNNDDAVVTGVRPGIVIVPTLDTTGLLLYGFLLFIGAFYVLRLGRLRRQ